MIGCFYAAARVPGGSACTADLHAQLEAILEREHTRGGSRPGLEQAADALHGPLYYCAGFTGLPTDPSRTSGLVDALLR